MQEPQDLLGVGFKLLVEVVNGRQKRFQHLKIVIVGHASSHVSPNVFLRIPLRRVRLPCAFVSSGIGLVSR